MTRAERLKGPTVALQPKIGVKEKWNQDTVLPLDEHVWSSGMRVIVEGDLELDLID